MQLSIFNASAGAQAAVGLVQCEWMWTCPCHCAVIVNEWIDMGGSKDKKEKSKGRRKDWKIKPESTNDTKRDGESRKDAEKKVKDPSARPPPEPDRKDKKDTSSKPAEHHRHRRRRGDEAVSPDNVAMVMGTPNQGGQVTVMIQLDSVKQHTIKAYLTNMLDSTLESLLEIKRKKYTLLYIVSLVTIWGANGIALISV